MVTDTKIQMIYIYTSPKLKVKHLPNKRMTEPNAEALHRLKPVLCYKKLIYKCCVRTDHSQTACRDLAQRNVRTELLVSS